MIKKLSLFLGAIAIGILGIFGGISLKNTAEPQYFLENTQVKNAVVETNTNEYTFYLDNNVNNYTLLSATVIFTPNENSSLAFYMENEKIQLNITDMFVFAVVEILELENVTANIFLIGEDFIFIKVNNDVNIETINIEKNTWFAINYNNEQQVFEKINTFTLYNVEINSAVNINELLNPYIGNLTSLPSEEPTPPLEQINTLVSDIVNWFTKIFNGLGNVFYDPTANKLTAWGTVLFIGVAIMLISMALKWVISLIRGV